MSRNLMTTADFCSLVISNFTSLPLKSLFLLSDDDIESICNQWIKNQSHLEYQQYMTAVLTLKDGNLLHNGTYCFFVSRNLLDETIVSLAESFFYDDKFASNSENPYLSHEPNIGQPFTKGSFKNRIWKDDLLYYFQEVFDKIYERDYNGINNTLSYLYSLTGDKRYITGEL